MAYNGYLLKIGAYEVPPDAYMKAESYKAYINMQDIDDWTDADGYLHRNVVDLKAMKIEFETPDMLKEDEFRDLMSNIQRNCIDQKKKEYNVEAYIPELGEYVTQKCYMVDIQPQIHSVFGNTINYSSLRFAFVGGLADE